MSAPGSAANGHRAAADRRAGEEEEEEGEGEGEWGGLAAGRSARRRQVAPPPSGWAPRRRRRPLPPALLLLLLQGPGRRGRELLSKPTQPTLHPFHSHPLAKAACRLCVGLGWLLPGPPAPKAYPTAQKRAQRNKKTNQKIKKSPPKKAPQVMGPPAAAAQVHQP